MGQSVKLSNFQGMNNIKKSEGLFVGKDGASCQPRIILNADVTSQGRLIKRGGTTKIIDLLRPHSLWAGDNTMLCVSGNHLYQCIQDTAIELCEISGTSNTTLTYAEIDNNIYISNKYWNKKFNSLSGVVSDWGLAVPEQPIVLPTNGNLPAGKYQVCFTRLSGSEISGNGAIASIELTQEGGINILNRGNDLVVWISDPNGRKMFLAGQLDKIISTTPSSEPLPSFLCSPPPFMEYIACGFGRIWGNVGNTLYYSEPFHPEWFNVFNKIKFDQEITLIAMVATGIFVGCKNTTYFLRGTEPEQMKQSFAGSGAIPGTLTYCNNLPELGDILSPAERVHDNIPVWLSQQGVVIGNAGGRLFNLTQQKVKFAPGLKGASVHRMMNGEFQYLTSFKQGSPGNGFGLADTATATVVRNGVVIS